MISVFRQFDNEEQQKLIQAGLGIPSEFEYESRLSYKIGPKEAIVGNGRLTGSRFVFFVENEIVRDLSVSWKVVEPFIDEFSEG
jgi:hypothetical protein